MTKKPSKYGIKIWMMCDCATKYMMNAEVYLGKENNEVARGLASDVVCTLVQPISGQDRGERKIVSLRLLTLQMNRKAKIDTCWDNEAKQKRNSTRVQACQAT